MTQINEDAAAFQYQEIAFSLVMTAVAVLGRDNPQVEFPELLWVFAGMLAMNLVYQLIMRRRPGAQAPALAALLVNTTLISAALRYSGGFESRFWPLYLLPIFTACLSLERRHVLWALGASAGFLSLFYLEALWSRQTWQACELLIKMAVLALSAAVTARLSFKERAHRAELRASRQRVEVMARSFTRRSAAELEEAGRSSVRSLIPGLVHELNNPLAVILGTVDLLLQDACEGSQQQDDLKRIRSSADMCAKLGRDLMVYARTQAGVS
jgi:signal transduction histidine kinase